MTLSREKWLQFMLTALAVTIAPASTSVVMAQGFGPDPFRPYNSQYDAYTYPMGPASAQGGGAAPRIGNIGANQYQGYLDELSGAGRQGTERYGIGMPYYRSAVDPSFDVKGTREYRPNYNADRSFDQSHEVITRKYLAYFTEKDPKKRAELLRDYNRSRTRVSRAMSGRREDPSRLVDAANGTEGRRSLVAGRTADDVGQDRDKPRTSSRFSSRESAAETGRSSAASAIPPAPALPGMATSRRGAPRRTPSEVLNRARRIDRGAKPSAVGPAATDSAASRRPLPTPPE